MVKFGNGLGWLVIRSSGSNQFWSEGLNLFEATAPFSAIRLEHLDAVARVQALQTATTTATARIFGLVPYGNRYKRSDGLFWLPLRPDRHLKFWHDGLGLTHFPNQKQRFMDAVARIQSTFAVTQDAQGRIQVTRVADMEALGRVQVVSTATQTAVASITSGAWRTIEALARIQAVGQQTLEAVAFIRTMPPEDRTIRVLRVNRVVEVEEQYRLVAPEPMVVSAGEVDRTVYVLRVDRTVRVPAK